MLSLQPHVPVAVFSPPIDIKQALVIPPHPVSVPIRHPSHRKLCIVLTSFETDIYIHGKYKITPGTYIRGILIMLGASLVFFPGAWWRGSWHFQVASLHLQSSMDLSLSASHYFSFLSKRSGRRMPPAERSALHFQYIYRERELLGASGGRSDGIHKTATTYLRQHHTTREAAQAARPAACVVRGAT